MKIAVFAYSRQGCGTARRILGMFPVGEVQAYTVERLAGDGFAPIPQPSRDFYGELFAWADALVFVGACGIAVRKIAPFVRDKQADPAVLAVDELGAFVIALLSGHIGGANDLAKRLAKGLHATPVITTATDIHGRFSVDAWAARNGYVISDIAAAKAVSAAILEGDVPLSSDFPIVTGLPEGVVSGNSGSVGIFISIRREDPFDWTLRLIPPIVHLGIGCRRGVQSAAVEEAVDSVLKEHGLDRRAVKCVASIDLKADEQGLLEFCWKNKWPVSFYSPEALREAEGDFTSSEFVRGITGVDNVCERAALLGAESLIVKKSVHSGVTVAVAVEHWEVRFG